MTTGAEVSIFVKPVMWVIGGLASGLAALAAYIWNDHNKKVQSVKKHSQELEKHHSDLALRLVTDYMTREQTEAMIESYNRPLIDALKENTETTRELIQELRVLRENQIKAGIYD